MYDCIILFTIYDQSHGTRYWLYCTWYSWKRRGAAVASKNNDTDGEGPVRVPKNQNFTARANWVTGESLFVHHEILLTYVAVLNLQVVCIIVL